MYELAQKAYQTYARNKGGTDALDRATAETSLRHYNDLIRGMNECIQSLNEWGVDTSYLLPYLKKVSTLSKK